MTKIVYGPKAALSHPQLCQPFEETKPLHDFEDSIAISLPSCYHFPFVHSIHLCDNDLPGLTTKCVNPTTLAPSSHQNMEDKLKSAETVDSGPTSNTPMSFGKRVQSNVA